MLKLISYSSCARLANLFARGFSHVHEDLRAERISYELSSLTEDKISQDPFEEFDKWFLLAKKTKEIREANAMILCTASKQGIPAGRPVLLKSFDDDGFVFFTNYLSRKSKEMEENPFVSLVFYWDFLEKVVRIEGKVSQIPEEESTEYFQSRPRESQIGAWASHFQSAKVNNRKEIEEKTQEYADKFKSAVKIPKPDFWGGWIVKPDMFEFWQGRSSRLHDRICFKREGYENDKWEMFRLSP